MKAAAAVAKEAEAKESPAPPNALDKCTKDIDAKLSKLREEYLNEGYRLKAQFQQDGELENTLAAEKEWKRCLMEKSLSEKDLMNQPEPLRTIQSRYLAAFPKAVQETAQDHVDRLTDSKKKLTIEGKLELAQAAQKDIDKIKAKYPPPPPPKKPPAAAASIGSASLDCDKEIQDKLVQLQEWYVKVLDILLARYQSHGELKKVLAVKTEQERFARVKNVGERDVVSEPEELLEAQTKYQAAPDQLAHQTAIKHVRKLVEVTKKLTFDGKLDDAVAVQKQIDVICQKYSVIEEDAAEEGETAQTAGAVAGTGRSGGFRLIKAVWGADNTWADVTAHVQRMIAAGSSRIEASGGVFGDPIFGRPKTLQITYILGGKQMTKSAGEGASIDVLELQAAPPQMRKGSGQTLKIIKATDGKGDRVADVTQQLQSLIVSNTVNAGRGWDLCRCDPSGGIVKETRVIYTCGGRRMEKVFGEHERVTLP